MTTQITREVLPARDWVARNEAYVAAASARTKDHLARRAMGMSHPVWDFLFEYYPVRPAHLSRWHPGLGVALEIDARGGSALRPPHAQWRFYRVHDGVVDIDLESFAAHRGAAVEFIRDLLVSTAAAPARFDCFGLHEWAMVYKGTPRHDLPLRLGSTKTAEVVDTHSLRCTHFDAFRFFTPPARPLNLTVLTREGQVGNEQCGCVHATMDLYKWAAKLQPLVPSELWLRCFDLACDARRLDMEASPYDCRSLGLGVVAIETTAGKAEYVSRQKQLAARGQKLRKELLDIIDRYTLMQP